MRNAVIIFLASWVLAGCSSNGQKKSPSLWKLWMEDNGKVKVLCTTEMIQDLVIQIGGDRVDSLVLVMGDLDPHSYELVKGDDEKFDLAKILFYNGLGLEHGASLHYRLRSHKKGVNLGQFLQEHVPEKIIQVDGEVDPHVWMDISLWAYVIDPIVNALIAEDPEGRALYEQRALELQENMKKKHIEIYSLLQSVPKKKRYIVTSHDAFNYFTRAYLATQEEIENGTWKIRFDAPEGLAPEGQLGSKDIQEVVDHLMLYQIHVVFPESNVSRDSLKKVIDVCRKKGFDVRLWPDVLYGDAIGPKDSLAGSYLGMVMYDATLLQKAWSSAEDEK